MTKDFIRQVLKYRTPQFSFSINRIAQIHRFTSLLKLLLYNKQCTLPKGDQNQLNNKVCCTLPDKGDQNQLNNTVCCTLPDLTSTVSSLSNLSPTRSNGRTSFWRYQAEDYRRVNSCFYLLHFETVKMIIVFALFSFYHKALLSQVAPKWCTRSFCIKPHGSPAQEGRCLDSGRG